MDGQRRICESTRCLTLTLVRPVVIFHRIGSYIAPTEAIVTFPRVGPTRHGCSSVRWVRWLFLGTLYSNMHVSPWDRCGPIGLGLEGTRARASDFVHL